MSQSSPKIKVAKQGKEIGEFSLWEVKLKLNTKEFLLSYDFWRAGMSSWGKLEDIKEEISNAQSPIIEPPPTPVINQQPPALPIKAEKGISATTVVAGAIGGAVLLNALGSSPDGSAIRQAVLTPRND